MTGQKRLLASIEEQTATLFLVAGGLFVVFAVCHGVEAFMNRPAPKDVFGPAGWAFAFLGLLGLYPTLVGRSRWLALTSALFAVLGVVGGVVTSVWHVGLWVLPAATPAYVTGFSAGLVLGQLLGYLTGGVASLRTGVHSRTVGLLLVAVPTVLVVMIVTVATGFATSGSAVMLGSVQALVHLAIGFSLRAEGLPDAGRTPAGEPTSR